MSVRALGVGVRGCEFHPHWAAVERCERCRRPFCAECLVRGRPIDPRRMCRGCADLPPDAELLALEQRARRRERLAGLPVIIALLLYGVLYVTAMDRGVIVDRSLAGLSGSGVTIVRPAGISTPGIDPRTIRVTPTSEVTLPLR